VYQRSFDNIEEVSKEEKKKYHIKQHTSSSVETVIEETEKAFTWTPNDNWISNIY